MKPGGRPSLQDVVNAIYDAALDAEQWAAAVGQASRYCRSSFGLLVLNDLAQGRASLQATTRPLDDVVSSWARQFCTADPGLQALSASRVDKPEINDEWVPRRRYLDSHLYRDILRPAGIEDRAGILVLRDARHAAVFGVARSRKEGPYDRNMVRLLTHLSPHFRRAIQITHSLGRAKADTRSLTDALDRMEDGVVLVDGSGRVVFLNSAAERIVSEGGLLTLRDGWLGSPEFTQSIELQESLHRAVQTGLGTGTDSGRTLVLRGADGVPRATVAVTPLRTSHGATRSGPESARAAVFVRETRAPARPSGELWRQVFGFTPAEARLAQALSAGERLQDVADRLGVSKATVRTQLQGIFDKTGARRQADLMKMLLALPLRVQP